MFLRVIAAIGEAAFREQPLTAPEVRPATMRRWNRSTSTTTGMVTMTAAAEMAAAGRWNWDAPVKKARAAGTGRARLVEVREMANTKSFQAKKKARMAAVNTPGAARGTMTLRKACHEVAPSICA